MVITAGYRILATAHQTWHTAALDKIIVRVLYSTYNIRDRKSGHSSKFMQQYLSVLTAKNETFS
jgi:predicted nuclease of restriction endonuclease-like (RecB) superfamily